MRPRMLPNPARLKRCPYKTATMLTQRHDNTKHDAGLHNSAGGEALSQVSRRESTLRIYDGFRLSRSRLLSQSKRDPYVGKTSFTNCSASAAGMRWCITR